MGYLDDTKKYIKKMNKKNYINISQQTSKNQSVKKKQKPQISEERALIKSILKEENISDKELIEILLRERRLREEKEIEEVHQQAEIKRLEEEAYQQAEIKRLAEEARQQAEIKRLEEEARQQAEIKRLAEEARQQAEIKRLADEARQQAEVKRLEEEARQQAEVKRLADEARQQAEVKRLEEEARLRKEMKELEEVRLRREARRVENEKPQKKEEKVVEFEEVAPMLMVDDIKEDMGMFWDKNQLNEVADEDVEAVYEAVRPKDEKKAKRKNRKKIKKQKRAEGKEKKKSIGRELLEWLIYIAIIVGVTYLIITYVGVKTKVSGSSMETTLHDSDSLIVDKLSYNFMEPERYDIVVFPYEYEENVYYIKRIIGLPGETVQIIDGLVYINGDVLESDVYGTELMESAGIAETPIVLGEDEYFVLGDNRNHSADSRDQSVGVLSGEDLIGKAWIRIWPISQFGALDNE